MTFDQSLRQAKKVWLQASYAGGEFELPITKAQARELFRQLKPKHDYDGAGDTTAFWRFNNEILIIGTVS